MSGRMLWVNLHRDWEGWEWQLRREVSWDHVQNLMHVPTQAQPQVVLVLPHALAIRGPGMRQSGPCHQTGSRGWSPFPVFPSERKGDPSEQSPLVELSLNIFLCRFPKLQRDFKGV